jgi:hypothetical protein
MNPAKKQRTEIKLDDYLFLCTCAEEVQHHLFYLCIVLDCDIPIIEALFYNGLSCFAVKDCYMTPNPIEFNVILGNYIFDKFKSWRLPDVVVNSSRSIRIIPKMDYVDIRVGTFKFTWAWRSDDRNRILWGERKSTFTYDSRRFEDILNEFLEYFKK